MIWALLRSRGAAIERASLRGRRLHSQRSSRELLSIHRPQRDGGVIFIPHLDESETARAAVEAVAHYLGSLDAANLGERLAQIAVAQRETQIAYE
jgi:hypothetical protein